MIKFRQKDFSVLGYTLQGATIGAGVGTMAVPFVPKKFKIAKEAPNDGRFTKMVKSVGNKANSGMNTFGKNLAVVGATTLVGAALGALVGVVEKVSTGASRLGVGKGLVDKVAFDLKNNSFKEDSDFTRDPKLATLMKMRVCIVITRSNGDLRLLVNTISDPDLRKLARNVTKDIPNSSVETKYANNEYNELTVTTLSVSSVADAGLVSHICTQFIRGGYPVYLIEAGN